MARKSRKPEAVKAAEPAGNDNIFNTALYVRLSVPDGGRKNGDTIVNQQEMLERYVAERPELTLKEVFVDNGETGVDFSRPAWNGLMRECRNGKINCIVVKDLSRVGRNYIETGELLEKIFPLLGVRLIAVNDGYDGISVTNGERLVANLKNLANDIYAKDISRKIIASVQTRQKNGDFIGAYAAYGYLKDPQNKRKLVVNPETAPVVRRIFEMKAEGSGNGAICRTLNAEGVSCPNRYRFLKGITSNEKHENTIWIIPTVAGILRNPLYLGHMAQGKCREALCEGKERKKTKRDEWVIVPDTHEAVVTQELFDRANEVFDKRAKEYIKNRQKYAHFERSELILYNHVFCADCGKALSRKKNVSYSGRRACWIYGCKKEMDLKACSKKYIRETDLLAAVYYAIRSEVQKCADIKGIIEKLNRESSHKSRLARYDAEIEETEREIKRIASLRQAVYEDYASKLLTAPEYEFAVGKYGGDAYKQRGRLEAAKREKAEYTHCSTPVNKWLAAFTRFMDEKELTAEMVQALIERVEVSGRSNVIVVFKFRDEYEAIRQYTGVM
jgi:DNA invertase Pin-like site-specific DNA recombinase